MVLLKILSCKRKLSKDELIFMPYKTGQILIFENQSNKKIDTILISSVEKYMPEGTQVYFNEAINAKNKNKAYLVSLFAGYGKYSDPYIKIHGLNGKYYLKEIKSKKEINFKTEKINFDDVIILNKKGSGNGNISKVFWSKSKGIVQYILEDKTIWTLIQ